MAMQVHRALMVRGDTQGQTVWLMSTPQGHRVQEVGFITVQMTKPSGPSCRPTALRLREGVDAVPSGECPPHYDDRVPRVWNFLDDDFFRLSQAGALIHFWGRLARAKSFSSAGPGDSPVRLGKHWGLVLGRKERQRPVVGGGGSESLWELLKLLGLHCQGT